MPRVDAWRCHAEDDGRGCRWVGAGFLLRVILTDWSFIASTVVAVVVLAALARFATSRFRRADLVLLAGVAAGVVVARPTVRRYAQLADRADTWMVVLLVLAAIVVVAAVGWSSSVPSMQDAFSVTLALATLGVFLCVPETGVLRFVMPPIVIAGLAAGLGLLRPFPPWVVIATTIGLAGLSVVDGRTRGSAIVGAAACLVAMALLPLVTAAATAIGLRPSPEGAGRSSGLELLADRRLLVIAVAVLACSRWAGLQSSAITAFVQAGLVLAVAAGVLLWLGPSSRRSVAAG